MKSFDSVKSKSNTWYLSYTATFDLEEFLKLAEKQRIEFQIRFWYGIGIGLLILSIGLVIWFSKQ